MKEGYYYSVKAVNVIVGRTLIGATNSDPSEDP